MFELVGVGDGVVTTMIDEPLVITLGDGVMTVSLGWVGGTEIDSEVTEITSGVDVTSSWEGLEVDGRLGVIEVDVTVGGEIIIRVLEPELVSTGGGELGVELIGRLDVDGVMELEADVTLVWETITVLEPELVRTGGGDSELEVTALERVLEDETWGGPEVEVEVITEGVDVVEVELAVGNVDVEVEITGGELEGGAELLSEPGEVVLVLVPAEEVLLELLVLVLVVVTGGRVEVTGGIELVVVVPVVGESELLFVVAEVELMPVLWAANII
jgi:hypothetical protein